MNLLEKAMRQKAMRESQASRQGDQALSEVVTITTPPQPVANRASHRLLIAGAIGVVLATAAIGILFAPIRNGFSSTLPAQAILTSENIGQFTAVAATPVEATPNKEKDNRPEVAAFVDSWVKAWSTKDVDTYLSAYAPEFEPSNGLTRSAWEKQRRQRLAKYKKIEIALANLTLSVEKDTATVEFIQSFKADDFSETGLRKRLDLKRQGSHWMIVRETSS